MPLQLMMLPADRHIAELARSLRKLHHCVHDKCQLSRAALSTECALYRMQVTDRLQYRLQQSAALQPYTLGMLMITRRESQRSRRQP